MNTPTRPPLIVTASDEAYAELLLDGLASLKVAQEKLPFEIGVLDLGLSEASRQKVLSVTDKLVTPTWPFSIQPEFQEKAFSLAAVCRLYLRDYFPGYPVYAWLDADVFAQGPQGIMMLVNAARHAGFAAVPTIDRSYVHTAESVQWVYARYRMAFDEAVVKTLMSQPYVNSGVWAANANSPMWTRWSSRFEQALKAWNGHRPCDQSILNYALQIEKIPHHKLPAVCNWVCHLAPPLYDPRQKAFVERCFPFQPILLVHNTFNHKHRLRHIRALDGTIREMRYRFADLNNPPIAPQADAKIGVDDIND